MVCVGSPPLSTSVRLFVRPSVPGSPSSQSPGTGTLLLRSPNVLANNDEALLTQIAAYKRVADELQRKNTYVLGQPAFRVSLEGDGIVLLQLPGA